MKFATIIYDNQECLAVYEQDEMILLSSLGYSFKDMNELIEKMTDEQIKDCKNKCLNHEGMVVFDYKWCSPIPVPKQDIICLGQNYAAHAEESMRYKKEAFALNQHPVYFSKRASLIIGHQDVVDSHFNLVTDLDYEVELAAVIRKDCRNVKKEEVKDVIFGYSVFNDISARTIQTRHKQWYFGKSLDTFCIMGPVLVTADEFEWPLSLNLTTKINDELRQNGNTSQMMFDLEHIICELSEGMTLKSGSIIVTGTPAGVGMGFNPPKFLKSGDTMECTIEKIGTLINIIQ